MDKLLKDLLLSDGVSGYEENVAKIMKGALSKVADFVETDNFGNVIAKKGKGKKKIMIAAHMDEIGLVVKHISSNGFIYFVKVGAINDSILPGIVVEIVNKKGEHIKGVLGTKPPHLMSAEEAKKPVKFDSMFIDIGLGSRKEVEKVVEIGDQIIFEPNAGVLNGDIYYGKAADNRISCYAMVKVLEKLPKNLDAEVYACATAQEEVGLKGGKTSSFKVNPDFALVIDTTVAGDMPGIEEKVSALKLGAGVALTFLEASGRGTIVPQKVRQLMLEAAKKNKIAHQIDIIDGGMTDGAIIYTNREGILTGILSIPTRYIHAPTSVFNIKDVESAVDLAVETIKKAAKEI
ncbi:M42 family metallopeptidase [Endomicrobium proavitum]|uniref:Cytoplasmic aminopeptidase M42 family peptidase n=1 Tax=Endomicrobium proavitum TaxID=1408281 RepID=A0A0G3WJ21_9BACT|nr:M20/M25/M40 family metallo-hydrolase [Endomicrobium proavitum]AKL97449.1 cytoplasmic aminopeptidase M42 family peptidase [Endomicrobium proavitum]